jgi:integrase/recombinase XerD
MEGMLVERQLRAVAGAGAEVDAVGAGVVSPVDYQAACVDGFVASQVARGFSPVTIDNGTGVLERFLALAGKPAWS